MRWMENLQKVRQRDETAQAVVDKVIAWACAHALEQAAEHGFRCRPGTDGVRRRCCSLCEEQHTRGHIAPEGLLRVLRAEGLP